MRRSSRGYLVLLEPERVLEGEFSLSLLLDLVMGMNTSSSSPSFALLLDDPRGLPESPSSLGSPPIDPPRFFPLPLVGLLSFRGRPSSPSFEALRFPPLSPTSSAARDADREGFGSKELPFLLMGLSTRVVSLPSLPSTLLALLFFFGLRVPASSSSCEGARLGWRGVGWDETDRRYMHNPRTITRMAPTPTPKPDKMGSKPEGESAVVDEGLREGDWVELGVGVGVGLNTPGVELGEEAIMVRRHEAEGQELC